MKILAVHNRYLQAGGEDTSHAAEVRLLRDHGHEVEEYLEDNARVALLGKLRTAGRTVWSTETYRRIRERLRGGGFSVVHVQNFFPLVSPAVYYAAKAEGVGVVQTLRNYRLFCTNAYLFRDGQVCEDCLGKPIAWSGIKHKCYRGSVIGSATIASMQSIHRAAGTWRRMVDRYVVLTDFAKAKCIQGGLPQNKLMVKPNFVNPDPGEGDGRGTFEPSGSRYLVFVGRLSEEKGVGTLLEAWDRIGDQIGLGLKIVGDGPMGEQVQSAADRLVGVQWLGALGREHVDQVVGGARALVFPSQWYEGMPRTIIESFAKGTPVIASRLGAMATMIEHGQTGFHFKAGDTPGLAELLLSVTRDEGELGAMRNTCREEYLSKYTAHANYQMLLDIFHQAVAKAKD